MPVDVLGSGIFSGILEESAVVLGPGMICFHWKQPPSKEEKISHPFNRGHSIVLIKIIAGDAEQVLDRGRRVHPACYRIVSGPQLGLMGYP